MLVQSGILEELTIDEVRELDPTVCVIPVGSTEPHGPALPYGTDSFRVQAVTYGATRRANEHGGRVLCLPTMRVSLNNNFRAFPFACRVSVPTFMAALSDTVAMCEAEGIRRIVIVNGHGGNTDVIRAVQRDLAARDGAFVCMLQAHSCASQEAQAVWEHHSDHAGEEETSEILALRPELVHREKAGRFPQLHPKVDALRRFGAEFVRPWHRYVPASAGGDATKANAEKGRTVLESSIRGLAEFLVELSTASDSESFPY
jgi:creatinine amidohydrolase